MISPKTLAEESNAISEYRVVEEKHVHDHVDYEQEQQLNVSEFLGNNRALMHIGLAQQGLVLSLHQDAHYRARKAQFQSMI